MAEEIQKKNVTDVEKEAYSDGVILGVQGGKAVTYDTKDLVNKNLTFGKVEQGDKNVVSGLEVFNNMQDIKDVFDLKIVNKNPFFNNGIKEWEKNDDSFDFLYNNGEAYYYTKNSENTGIMQNVRLLKNTKYKIDIELYRINDKVINGSIGLFNVTSKVFTINNNELNTISFDIEVDKNGDFLFLFAVWSKNSEFNIKKIVIREFIENGIFDDINVYNNDLSSKPFMPKKNFSKTSLNQLDNFIKKYLKREEDITIVQIGDSISTDLNWTEKRKDAKFRPPFCTEYNINSYIEEKLRYTDQEYRRFDCEGVFKENLGGGIALNKEIDSNWGAVGNEYYMPLSRVIDGGNNSSISFKILKNIKRLNLILHTDRLFTESSQILIGQGYGEVEVFDGNNWVEANGFITYQKEPDTSNTLGFLKDNAQKRIKFRSINNLNEKDITFVNNGNGRLSYWGIEYTPNNYFFTYICASKGSHSINMLERYEEWMVDSFKPDLLLWQLPILNENLGKKDRGFGSKNYGDVFLTKYNKLKSKGYNIITYIAWAASYSNYIDENGNYLSSRDSSNEFISCECDVNNLHYQLLNNNAVCLNYFNNITEIAKYKSNLEDSNIYKSAMLASGKNGNTFTTDSIHLNKLGQLVLWRLLEDNFNF